MKSNKGFRLDILTAKRLEDISERLKLTQTELLERLINACFEEHSEDWFPKEYLDYVKGFDRFRSSMFARMDLLFHGEDPNK